VKCSLALAVGLLLALAPGARAADAVLATEAVDLVLRQLAALRAHDFAGAYALASVELRRHFSRGEYEWMVKRTQPEIASSAYAFVVRTHESGGYLYVTVKVHGKNGQDVEALYEVVREGEALKVNAVSSRRDDGVL
jgi:hypothetical protein